MIDYVDLTTFIASNIVEHVDEVSVMSRQSGRQLVVTVSANPDDMGKLIGRHGRNIEAFRTVVRVAGLRHRQRVQVDMA